MPDADLDRVVADRIAAYRPEHVPPFPAVEAARHRRLRARTGVAAGLAAVAAAGALAAPPLLRDDPIRVLIPDGATQAAVPADPLPPTLGDRPSVADARRLWQARGARSYTITVTVSCFCVPTGPHRVTVRDGRTVGSGPSVDDLFATIESPDFDRVSATYDPRYGFPTRIAVDPNLDTIDEERTFTVTDYRPRS